MKTSREWLQENFMLSDEDKVAIIFINRQLHFISNYKKLLTIDEVMTAYLKYAESWTEEHK